MTRKRAARQPSSGRWSGTAHGPYSMSASAVDSREPSPPIKGRAGVAGLGKTAWALIVALVALAASASSLVFTFLPQLKPDPRDSVAAQLSIFAIEPGVTIGEYLRRAYGSVTAEPNGVRIPPEERGFLGELVYARVRVDGYKHRRVQLTAEIYDASTQQRVEIPNGVSSTTALAVRTVELDTPSTSTVQLFWILNLAGNGPAFVRIEMSDANRMLAVADSPVIDRKGRAPLPTT